MNGSLAQIPLGDRSMAPPTVHNPPPGPVKQSRTGTTKMRPSKSSTTPRWCIIFDFMGYSNNILRNLCALEWAVSNPKGTTDEFSTYYEGLSAEAKAVSILKYLPCHILMFFW